MSFKAAQRYPNRLLAFYQSRLEQQKQVLYRIRKVLPAPLAQHALHCVIDEKKLLLYTESAAWASQLRFYKSAILAAIATENKNTASTLQIRILNTPPGIIKKTVIKANIPSSEKIAMLRSQCDNVADPELRQALAKLSTTLSRLDKRAFNPPAQPAKNQDSD